MGFTFQICFAENIKFKSTSKGKDGNPLLLTGVLTKPEGSGPFPAVVLLHGWCVHEFGKPRSDAWSGRLVDWGYVTLQLDSFGPRNVSNDCSDKTELFSLSLARGQDTYDAKDFLAELPYIDRNRIALLGWSHGGHASLYVLLKQIKPQSKETPFKAGIVFYPYCDMPLYNLNAPLLILIGESDDWTLAKECSEMMPSEQPDLEITLKIYPGAYHDFDWEGMDQEVELFGGHRMLYDPIAAKDSIIQVKSFLAKHLIQKEKKSGKAAIKPFDLSGTWIVTDEWEGCNKSRTDKWTVEISHSDDMIKLLNIERNNSYSGMINNNIISVSEYEYPSRTGTDATNTVHDYKFIDKSKR